MWTILENVQHCKVHLARAETFSRALIFANATWQRFAQNRARALLPPCPMWPQMCWKMISCISRHCRRKKAFTGNSKTIRACPCWLKEYFLYLKEMFGSQGLLRYMTIFASWSHYWLVVCFAIHGHIHLLFDPKPWLFPYIAKEEQHLGLQHFHVSTMSTRYHT